MPGVEILSSQTIYQTENLWWFILLGAGLGFLVSLIAAIIDGVSLKFEWIHISFVLACTVVGCFIGLIPAALCEIETDTIDYIEYKVTVDDSVSMNEFLDKYEILDQEGKIYTVKER